MEAPPCPKCHRKALYTIYGGAEPMLRCKKCGREWSVLLVPPTLYKATVEALQIKWLEWLKAEKDNANV